MAREGCVSDARWELVERVADSSLFQKSARLRDLLFYICERSLQSRHEELREQRIGEDVFARGPDFRPSEDNIVRVEAARLRKRLEEYFATEGRDEAAIITIPKGAYIASFETRASGDTLADSAEGSAGPTPPIEPPVGAPAAPQSRRRAAFSWTLLFALTTVVFGSLAVWFFARYHQVAPALAEAARAPSPRGPLWAELFNKDHQTYIVCSDTGLLLFEQITRTPVTLAEYVSRSYGSRAPSPPSQLEDSLRLLLQRQYTGIHDTRVAQAILQLNNDYRDRAAVQSARSIDLADFKNANFVLLGARLSDPWVQLFEPSLNFQFVFDLNERRAGFRNVHPRPGEENAYWNPWAAPKGPAPAATYSVIAFVPNLRHNGSVLLIAGTTGEGTEAAGLLITNPVLTRRMLDTIHASQAGRIRYFEVLLKSGMIAGISTNAELVAYRLIPSDR